MTSIKKCSDCGEPSSRYEGKCYGCAMVETVRRDALNHLTRAAAHLEQAQEALQEIPRPDDQQQADDIARFTVDARAARQALNERLNPGAP